MKHLLPILIILIFPFLVSCEKELDFKYKDVESQLVIVGKTSERGNEVTLSFTTPMNEPLNHRYLTDADVVIKDVTDNTSYELYPDEEGIFINESGGIPGHEYRLTVNHEGKTYESTCLMRYPVEILELKFQWIKMPYDHVAILEITSTISETENTCYWTRIYRNGEPYKWLVSHGSGAVDGILNQTTFTTRQDLEEEDDKDMLKDGDLVSVVIAPVSLEMYDYLTGISSDSNGPSMFSGDYCLGYFLAAQETESSIIFHPDDIPYYK